ncbi:MAG: hypothetical protein AAGM67_21995, partial [Bacteroidota bacterium]
MNRSLSLCLAFLLFVFSSLSAASVYTVSSTSNSGSGSFREAVGLASAGDTIRFAASLSGTPITLSSEVSIDHNGFIDG